MTRIPVSDAKTRLDDLVRQAAEGEDIVIEGDGASVRLVVQPPAALGDAPKPKRMFGRGKGLYEMRDDFDDPIPGFEPYM